jgi:hypothetical protein
MSRPEEIFSELSPLANQWQLFAILWHLYFAALAVALAAGLRPSKRVSSILLVLPLFAVSVLAWFSYLGVDGVLTGLTAIVLFWIAIHLPHERVHIAASWFVSFAILLFISGWANPYFLPADAQVTYFNGVPTAFVPSPTISAIIALSLLVNGLESRSWSIVLGGVGLFYGVFGVLCLGMPLDLFLITGALLSIFLLYLPKSAPPIELFAPKGV